MHEVLNISVTADARELFIEHDVATVKKIKATALDKISHKQAVLRKFIGDNYRPLLEAPKVLSEIKAIFEETKEIVRKMDALNQEFIPHSAPSERIQPLSLASETYLQSRRLLDANQFREALEYATKASKYLAEEKSSPVLVKSVKCGVDSLPRRIFKKMSQYLITPEIDITSNSLLDCFNTAEMLCQVGVCKQSPTEFLTASLVSRVSKLIESGSEIGEVCIVFIGLIEAIVTFLASVKEQKQLLYTLVKTFKDEIAITVDKFAKCDVRDILRIAKSTEDALRNRMTMPSFVSAMKDLELNVNFWTETFIDIFSSICARTITFSIENLDIRKRVGDILNRPPENFNAMTFALNKSDDLKARSHGVSPVITNLQKNLDSIILTLSSQLQSQTTRVADITMLKKPLTTEMQSVGRLLESSIQQAPLCVYLLAGAVCSPTIVHLIGDAPTKQITKIQDTAAIEWARRKATELKPLLMHLPKQGAAFCYLFELEKSILEAGGHISHSPLDTHLRTEAFNVVIEFFKGEIDKTVVDSGSIEQRKLNETRAECLFRDYCILSKVLSGSGHSQTRKNCLAKMNPINLDIRLENIESEVDMEIDRCMSLIKLISGGRAEQKEVQGFDVDAHLAKLFDGM